MLRGIYFRHAVLPWLVPITCVVLTILECNKVICTPPWYGGEFDRKVSWNLCEGGLIPRTKKDKNVLGIEVNEEGHRLIVGITQGYNLGWLYPDWVQTKLIESCLREESDAFCTWYKLGWFLFWFIHTQFLTQTILRLSVSVLGQQGMYGLSNVNWWGVG